MAFCLACFLRKIRRSPKRISAEQHYHSSSDFATELETSPRFLLNSLIVLLTILSISGFKGLEVKLQPVALVLVIYTNSLRLSETNFPSSISLVLSRCLYAIPILGTCCIIGVELISYMQLPELEVGLLRGMSLLVTIGKHGMSTAGLPMQTQDVITASADTTLVLAH